MSIYGQKKLESVNYHDVLNEIFSNSEIKYDMPDLPIAIYGAGELGQLAYHFFSKLGIKPTAVIDQNANTRPKAEWLDAETLYLAPDEISNKDNWILLLAISSLPIVNLSNSLVQSGWKNVIHFYDYANQLSHTYPLNNGWYVNLTELDKVNILKVFGELEPKSQLHYLHFLSWRVNRVELTSSELDVESDSKYFIPEVREILSNAKHVVDAGAHTGSFVERFFFEFPTSQCEVTLIEPDPKNLKQIDINRPRVNLIDKVLLDSVGTVRFQEGYNYCSKASPFGDSLCQTITLEELNPFDVLKLHLEGDELKVLKGGVSALIRNRPLIMATIYHNEEGLWQTMLFIKNTLAEYKLYVRSHGWCGTGTVLYAIPKERLE